MREIKFRAWDKLKTTIISPEDITDIDFGAGWFSYYDDFGINDENYFYSPAGDSRFTLMQYAGLKDKNGVDIFEGDVLLHLGNRYIVKWDNHMAAFQSENVKDKIDADFFNWGSVPSLQTQGVPDLTGGRFKGNCEVIGNIYENKDLL